MLTWHGQNSVALPLFFWYMYSQSTGLSIIYNSLHGGCWNWQWVSVLGKLGKQTDDTTLLLLSSIPPYTILLTCLISVLGECWETGSSLARRYNAFVWMRIQLWCQLPLHFPFLSFPFLDMCLKPPTHHYRCVEVQPLHTRMHVRIFQKLSGKKKELTSSHFLCLNLTVFPILVMQETIRIIIVYPLCASNTK